LECQVLSNTGNTLSNLGRYEEAIESYNQSINVALEFAPSYIGLAGALCSLGRHEEAIEAYQMFLKLWHGDQYNINRSKQQIENLQN